MPQQIWALDCEPIRSALVPHIDLRLFSVSSLPAAGALQDIDALVIGPDPTMIEWLETIMNRRPGLSVYLLGNDAPRGKILEHYYRLGVKGCFTRDESDELLGILRDSAETTPENTAGTLRNMDWCNQLKRFGFITQDPRLYDLFESVKRVAKTDATVLITGENGTGKEVVARLIHSLSSRSTQSFMAVHTGAIPENLLESELFGHVRGAFTSAIKDRKGKFEVSNGGTIFLDEISTMPAALQVKLLRVLQYMQFERVGDNQLVRVDVRIISATNSDLGKMVASGQFREDLFYRLNVVPIHIPPLRERLSDIAVLATHFVDLVCKKYSIPAKKFSLGAIRLFQQYHWPGNIRQLENIVERMVVLNPEVTVFMPRHVPQEVMLTKTATEEKDVVDSELLEAKGLSLSELIRNIEKKLILDSLHKTHWNKQQAAKLLKIKRTTLIEKMKRLEDQYEE